MLRDTRGVEHIYAPTVHDLFMVQVFIATANHNILHAGYQRVLGSEWSPDWRFRRIREARESRAGSPPLGPVNFRVNPPQRCYAVLVNHIHEVGRIHHQLVKKLVPNFKGESQNVSPSFPLLHRDAVL